MNTFLKLIFTPLLSLFVFTLGNGLFVTLVIVRLHDHGTNTFFIGAMTGVYYAGLAYGSFNIERYLIKVGHIRAFAAFASSLSILALIHGIFLNPWLWLILRFASGFATAGILIVIESWLLAVGSPTIRGKILAVYMISLYAALSLGQFLINISNPKTLDLFALTAILSSLSVIPLALTKAVSPTISEPSSLNLKALFKASGSGAIGSFCSGMILGAIYGLLPLVIMQKTGRTQEVALFMALVISGGMTLQYPVGKLSDSIERRLVLTGLSVLTALFSCSIIFSFKLSYIAYIISFLLGGLVFTLYPVSVSHACDSLDQKDIVSGAQGMLLAYSIGATLGPFVAPFFMKIFGSNGLFVYLAVISILLVFFLLWRKFHLPPKIQEESFMVSPQTTPVIAELYPRGDGSKD